MLSLDGLLVLFGMKPNRRMGELEGDGSLEMFLGLKEPVEEIE